MKPNKRPRALRRSKSNLWKEYGDFLIAIGTLTLMVVGVMKLRSSATEPGRPSAAIPREVSPSVR